MVDFIASGRFHALPQHRFPVTPYATCPEIIRDADGTTVPNECCPYINLHESGAVTVRGGGGRATPVRSQITLLRS